MALTPVSLTTWANIPVDILQMTFCKLDFASLLAARSVAQQWNFGVTSTPLYLAFCEEKRKLEKLFSSSFRLSDWHEPPLNWTWCQEGPIVAHLTHVGSNFCAFTSNLGMHSSKFISLSKPKLELPFPAEDALMAEIDKTFFFTPIRTQPDSFSYQLISGPWQLKCINLNDQTRSREFSILNDLPQTEDNLLSHRIGNVFPLTKDTVVVHSHNQKLSFWDLSQSKPICTKSIPFQNRDFVTYRMGNYLISGNEISDLKKQSTCPHGFNLNLNNLKTFESGFCHFSEKGKIEWFQIDQEGLIEPKWSKDPSSVIQNVAEKPGPSDEKDLIGRFPREKCKAPDAGNHAVEVVAGQHSNFPRETDLSSLSHQKALAEKPLSVHIHAINEQFVLVMINSKTISTLFALSSAGEVVHQFHFPSSQEAYSVQFQLSGNILILSKQSKRALEFWHLLSQRCLKVYDLTEKIRTNPQVFWPEEIQNYRFSEGRLTVLVSAIPPPSMLWPKRFRIIEFDTKAF
jgi:hypothetical protein